MPRFHQGLEVTIPDTDKVQVIIHLKLYCVWLYTQVGVGIVYFCRPNKVGNLLFFTKIRGILKLSFKKATWYLSLISELATRFISCKCCNQGSAHQCVCRHTSARYVVSGRIGYLVENCDSVWSMLTALVSLRKERRQVCVTERCVWPENTRDERSGRYQNVIWILK